MISPTNGSPTKGLVVAAPHSSSGKTTFCLGLAAALKARGLNVQVAKCGPGYIDPQFLSAAIGQACFNLDKWAMGTEQMRARASQISAGADVFLLEGMMGLLDGANGMSGSTADIAADLDLPVVLLIDASGQSQSIIATVYGFVALAKGVKICGVVANRVGSERHANMLREALEEINIPLLGAVMRSDSLTIPSRHLGLVQAEEVNTGSRLVEVARKLARAGRFFKGLREAAARGTLIYGECGGYMVLGRHLIDSNGAPHQMAGLLDHVTSFETPKLHLGYRVLMPQDTRQWRGPFRGHEFHYSTLHERGADAPLFHVEDARGTALGFAGGRRGSVMGSYMHIIDRGPVAWRG
ncbi:MAG: AAA family ATPase [Henriciella sp.]|nr:AAA family ATPase [Henriciella sp.]